MSQALQRRDFLKTTAALGIGYWIAPEILAADKSPSGRVAFGAIGVGGKGDCDTKMVSRLGNVVALCDVDEKALAAASKKYKKAKTFTDFRKMLETMGDSIDAVTVSTTDHTHAPAALMAMRMGKHCFCQKPLTHTIYEARLMGQVAREKKVATQMGNQGTAEKNLRKSVTVLQSGVLGAPKEVHVWTNRPVWPQGESRPSSKPCPESLHWNEWLGPAPLRPFAEGYHPFKWRGWWDFGCGALGDMACHTMNMPFWALDLRNPVAVQAETSGHNGDSFPKWSIITYEFAATDKRPAVKLFWYDGGKKPDQALFLDQKVPETGSITLCEKGNLLSTGDYSENKQIVFGEDAPEVDWKKVKYEKPPGGGEPHYVEWVRAIKGGPPAKSNFPDYASALTETVLLGNLAVWVAAVGQGEKVLWDAEKMKVTNIEGLESMIKPTYRDGYTLDV
ncbi:MAG: Gfo/Idh/MocA family oxidoreductase [Pirellulales bacterium]|nr:Gfo/Idh/MocA family oxidoreductase [Pirellulales bacterium]